MHTKNVAVIIASYNKIDLLKNCLDTLTIQSYDGFKIIVVDNGSTDGTDQYIKKNFPYIELIKLPENLGFARGFNAGILRAFEDPNINYIATLNNDTLVSKDWLKSLLITIKKDEKTGMVTSKGFFTDGNIQNAGLSLEKALQSPRYGGISIGYGEKDKDLLKKEIEVFAPGGVAALFKAGILKELYKRDGEIFDEDFFSYSEDLDLGFRIRLLGWKCYLSPNAKLIHLHSQTAISASLFKVYYSTRNKVLLAIKNLPLSLLPSFLYHNIKLQIIFFKAKKKNPSIRQAIEKNKLHKVFYTILKAYILAIPFIPKMLKKRKKIQSAKNVTVNEIKTWFEIFGKDKIEEL